MRPKDQRVSISATFSKAAFQLSSFSPDALARRRAPQVSLTHCMMQRANRQANPSVGKEYKRFRLQTFAQSEYAVFDETQILVPLKTFSICVKCFRMSFNGFTWFMMVRPCQHVSTVLTDIGVISFRWIHPQNTVKQTLCHCQ